MKRSLPRLEITSVHRSPANRRTFRLVLHDHRPSVVWTGDSYDHAILAAGEWARQGVDVIDKVDVGDIDAPNFVPRVPAAWQIVEAIGVVDGIHVEIWRQRRSDTDRVVLALSPTPGAPGFTIALRGDADLIPIMKLIAPAVMASLQAASASWRQVRSDLV